MNRAPEYSDICRCGHTYGSHESGRRSRCGDCACKSFCPSTAKLPALSAKSPRGRRAVDELRDLAAGGLASLRAAERLVNADGQIQIRVSKSRKALYAKAAELEGKTLTRWLIDLADKAAT